MYALLMLPQVLFNRDYMETDHDEEANLIMGGDVQEVCGVKYVLHRYGGLPVALLLGWCLFLAPERAVA